MFDLLNTASLLWSFSKIPRLGKTTLYKWDKNSLPFSVLLGAVSLVTVCSLTIPRTHLEKDGSQAERNQHHQRAKQRTSLSLSFMGGKRPSGLRSLRMSTVSLHSQPKCSYLSSNANTDARIQGLSETHTQCSHSTTSGICAQRPWVLGKEQRSPLQTLLLKGPVSKWPFPLAENSPKKKTKALLEH